MTWALPALLVAAGLLVMYQPRTARWQKRLRAHLGGDEQKLKKRANTFFLLGFAFVLTGISIFFRMQ